MRFEPSAAGHSIGDLCLYILREFTPDTLFDNREEALRFRFAVGTAIVMFAKQITAATIAPHFVQAMCDAIEDPFYLLIKNLDPDISMVDVIDFLRDEEERDLYCRFTRSSRAELIGSASLNVMYSALYPYRERLYYQDLQAAAHAARGITDGSFSVLGVMVFVFKRVVFHVYGIKTDMRNRFLEDELFDFDPERDRPSPRTPAVCGLILSKSYDILRGDIERVASA